MAHLFPDTACRSCGKRGEALVPADCTEHGTAGYCSDCERNAWDRAAHQQAFWLQENENEY